MMKRILALSSLIFSIEANAANLFKMPVVDWSRLQAVAPATEIREYCDIFGGLRGNCMGIAYRPDAPYGQKFLIVMKESTGKTLMNGRYNPYSGLPDPIGVVAVPDGDYPRIIGSLGMTAATAYPPPGYLPETDPDVGYKMLYCQGGAFVCAAATGIVAEMAGLKMALTTLKTCAFGTYEACKGWMDAEKKEQAYYKKWEQWNREQGIGPTPFEKVYPDLVNPNYAAATGGGGAGGSGRPGGGPAGGDSGGMWEKCYGSVITVAGGPLGETIEYPEVDCYYN